MRAPLFLDSRVHARVLLVGLDFVESRVHVHWPAVQPDPDGTGTSC